MTAAHNTFPFRPECEERSHGSKRDKWHIEQPSDGLDFPWQEAELSQTTKDADFYAWVDCSPAKKKTKKTKNMLTLQRQHLHLESFLLNLNTKSRRSYRQAHADARAFISLIPT